MTTNYEEPKKTFTDEEEEIISLITRFSMNQQKITEEANSSRNNYGVSKASDLEESRILKKFFTRMLPNNPFPNRIQELVAETKERMS